MSPNEIAVDRSEDGVAVLSLVGEHEALTAPRLDRELSALLVEGTPVVVDLTNTSFVDSTIVSVLLRAREDAQAQGTKFALVLDDSTAWAVRRLFDVTGLESVFAVGSSRDEALAAAPSP